MSRRRVIASRSEHGRKLFVISLFFFPNNGADIRLFAVSESDRVVAELMCRNASTLPMSYRPVILSSGLYSLEEAEEIMESAREEVENVRVKQYAGVRWHCDIHGFSRADFFSHSGTASGLFVLRPRWNEKYLQFVKGERTP